MTKRLLSHDALTGISAFHEYDSQTDETKIIYTGDSTPYLEQSKAEANDDDQTKIGIKAGFWRYASIPPAVQIKWLVEHGVDVYNKDHGEAVGKLVNSPEYRYLKTTTKHHKFK